MAKLNEVNKLNDSDVILRNAGKASSNPYETKSNEDSGKPNKTEVGTKVFTRLKIGKTVAPDTDNETTYDLDYAARFHLLQLRKGIPVGSYEAFFKTAPTHRITNLNEDGTKTAIPISRKNFLMMREEAEDNFPPIVDAIYKQSEGSVNNEDIHPFWRKLEIYLKLYGPVQTKVFLSNEDNPNISFFKDKTIEDGADSFFLFHSLDR